MSQVNTQVYGTPDTWVRDTAFNSNSSVPDSACFKRGQYTTIEAYCNAQKMAEGTAIDYSICYAAHDVDLPLSRINCYYTGDTGLEEYTYNSAMPWFFGHQTGGIGGHYDRITAAGYVMLNDNAGLEDISEIYWLPNGIIRPYPEQMSGRMIPIVEFNPHACYFGIKVVIFDRSNGQFNTYTLKQVREGTWNTNHVIVRAYGELLTRRTTEADYNYTNSSGDERCAVCLTNKLDFLSPYGEKSMPVLSYSFLISENLPLFGSPQGRPAAQQFSNIWRAVYQPYYNTRPADGEAVLFSDTLETTYTVLTGDYDVKYFEKVAPITEANLEKLRRCAAAYGLFFTEDDAYTKYHDDANRWTDADMFLGVLDNGIGRGDYTRGTGNIDNPVFNWGSSQQSPYSPDTPIDPDEPDTNTYSNITGFNSISAGASMTKRYVLDRNNVDKLCDDLFTISGELAEVQGNLDYDHFEAKVIDNFLVTSPIDAIVSLKRFPFNVPHTFNVSKELVKLGKNTATAQGYATFDVFNTVQFKGVNISKRFGGCFLDYEPYTQYELYVPFCGTTNLQAADIVGHTLNVRLQIDLITGTCTAYIMADSLVIETLTGNVACDLQITGTDSAYMNSALTNAVTASKTAKTRNITTSFEPLSPAGVLKTVANPWSQANTAISARYEREQADYNLTHLQTPLHSMGTASALTGWYQEFNARLMIYYPTGQAVTSSIPPTLANLSNYGHTTGFATVENKTLSNYTGLTVCSDVDLSGISQATATEKQMIYNALTGGVYI